VVTVAVRKDETVRRMPTPPPADPGRDEVFERANALKRRGWGDVLEPRPVLAYRNGHRKKIEVVKVSGAKVEVNTANAFVAMRTAAAEAGIDLWIESGFRTRKEQAALYRKYRKGRGNKAARPGRSNHQSGRALDIAVSSPGALEWMEQNASRFGFKRTVRSEPWHWEYVDAPRASGPKRLARSKRNKSRAAKSSRRSRSRRASR
jgi:hypothetical protein